MKNKINDLRDHMFLQLERLNDENLTPEEMEQEIKKAHAIKGVGDVIVKSAIAEVNAMKLGLKGSDFIPNDKDEVKGIGRDIIDGRE